MGNALFTEKTPFVKRRFSWLFIWCSTGKACQRKQIRSYSFFTFFPKNSTGKNRLLNHPEIWEDTRIAG
jgi:hypothetical protein